jgi:hypothetical protein
VGDLKRRLLAVLLFVTVAHAAEYPAPKSLGDTGTYGKNIQRTMRLLTESTAKERNTVRILFYGQSITEQGWWKLVAEDLRARFPHANLIMENRALGGFASQMLVKTAETDLYAFQPDLLIFQVYGAHNTYEDIIRRTRERTCAEILMQNDHVNRPENLTEETDPAKVPIQSGKWDEFMNHNWLPSLSRKYGTELCDQRGLWKQYLRDHELVPQALLKDGVHLNAHGEYFMAECVKAYLRRDTNFDPAPAEAWVQTLVVGKDVHWKDGRLQVAFTGNRVDVLCKAGEAAPAAVTIDGKKPSDFPECYGLTRALAMPGSKWPPVAPITSETPLLLEEWTLHVRKNAEDAKLFSFTITGSITGPDGEGRSDARFVSKSGRVVIAPEDWNVDFALGVLAGLKPIPETFDVRWRVVPQFVDAFVSPGVTDPTVETTVRLAQGLANASHTLEITGSPDTPIAAIRVYRPPLARE